MASASFQNSYTLPDLVDLSLKVPEIGAVNFNLLHTVLRTMIAHLRLNDVRPWCRIESPQLAQMALQRARLREDQVPDDVRKAQSPPKGKKEEPSGSKDRSSDEESSSSSSKEITTSRSEETSSDKKVESKTSSEDSTDGKTTSDEDKMSKRDKKKLKEWSELAEETQRHRKSLILNDETMGILDIRPSEETRGQRLRTAQETWRYTNLTNRLQGAEEGLMRLTNIVDAIIEKIKAMESRKKEVVKPTGPSGQTGPAPVAAYGGYSEELELLEERIENLEEAKIVFDKDHETLAVVENVQQKMLEEFEEIKALGEEIKEMRDMISEKANMKDVEEALALKGDLELVMTKVDQTEFETAIEELGEAIGTLGLKFQHKVEEWDELHGELWRGVESKMSRDVFDAAMVKAQARTTALLHGLQKLKEVVGKLLYPDCCAVTRCVACRRPGGITGQDCVHRKESPKRPYKSSTESSDNSDRGLKTFQDIITKRLRINGSPYNGHDISTSENDQTTDSTRAKGRSSADRSKIPNLPPIRQTRATSLAANSKAGGSRTLHMHKPLVYTHKVLARNEKSEEKKHKEITLALAPIHSTSSLSKESISSAGTGLMSDTIGNAKAFVPIRFMKDPLRRDIIQSSSETSEQTPSMMLASFSDDKTSDEQDSSTSSSS